MPIIYLDFRLDYKVATHPFQAQGRLADALREFEADLVIAQQLVARDPGNSVWQENLNVTRTCIDQMQRG